MIISDHFVNNHFVFSQTLFQRLVSYRDHFIGQKFDIFFCFLWVKRGIITLVQNAFQQFHGFGLLDVKLYCQLSIWLVLASKVITSCNYVNQFSLSLFSWFFQWKPTSRKRPHFVVPQGWLLTRELTVSSQIPGCGCFLCHTQLSFHH